MQQKKEVDLRVVEAVEEAQKPQDDLITLSTGVVLRGKYPPPLVMIKVSAAFPRPKPPIFHNKVLGRDQENPDDPEYLEQLKAWKMESGDALLNTMILLGTEFVSVPKGFPKPTDDSWLEEYSLLGIAMRPENKFWRYLNWVTFKAAPSSNDLSLIKEVVGRLSGIPEKEVEAAETFPGSDNGPG